jgi:hypothetical protein
MEVIVAALWFNSDDPSEKASAKAGIQRAVAETAKRKQMNHGPIQYRVLEPDSDEITVSPPAKFGPGTKCLVGEAPAEQAYHVLRQVSGFTHELETKDLEALRAETRRSLDLVFPHDKDRSNARIDAVINEIGPETALRTLEETVH